MSKQKNYINIVKQNYDVQIMDIAEVAPNGQPQKYFVFIKKVNAEQPLKGSADCRNFTNDIRVDAAEKIEPNIPNSIIESFAIKVTEKNIIQLKKHSFEFDDAGKKAEDKKPDTAANKIIENTKNYSPYISYGEVKIKFPEGMKFASEKTPKSEVKTSEKPKKQKSKSAQMVFLETANDEEKTVKTFFYYNIKKRVNGIEFATKSADEEISIFNYSKDIISIIDLYGFKKISDDNGIKTYDISNGDFNDLKLIVKPFLNDKNTLDNTYVRFSVKGENSAEFLNSISKSYQKAILPKEKSGVLSR